MNFAKIYFYMFQFEGGEISQKTEIFKFHQEVVGKRSRTLKTSKKLEYFIKPFKT